MRRWVTLLMLLVLQLCGCGGGGGGSDAPTAPLVSITLDPSNARAAVNTGQRFTATGLYADGTKRDLTGVTTWSTAGHRVAAFNRPGLASTLTTPGTAAVRARFANISSVPATLTVTPATLTSIAIDPATPRLAAATSLQMLATGLFSDGSTQDLTGIVSWGSSDPRVATVSDAFGSKGRATGVTAGSIRVTAALNGVQGGSTVAVTSAHLVALQILPEHPTVAAGSLVQFTVQGTFSDGSTQDLTPYATWGSSSTRVATVDNAAGSWGSGATFAPGSCTISADFGTLGGATTLNVTGATLVSLAVTPAGASASVGSSAQLAAVGNYSDGSHQDLTTMAIWSSTDAAIATVSNAEGTSGTVAPLTPGRTTIRAEVALPGGALVSGETTLQATPAELTSLVIDAGGESLPLGTTGQVRATGMFGDGSSQDLTSAVTWSSSDPEVAQVSNAAGGSGKTTPLATGSTTLSATLGTITGTARLTVTPLDILNLQGDWVGSYTIYDAPGNPGETNKTYAFRLLLSQSGSTITASPTLRGSTGGSSQLVGMVQGSKFTFSFTYLSPANQALMTDIGTAQVVGEVMTGQFVENSVKGYNCSYTFTLTRAP